MIEPEHLNQAVDTHRRTFALLRWRGHVTLTAFWFYVSCWARCSIRGGIDPGWMSRSIFRLADLGEKSMNPFVVGCQTVGVVRLSE